jgi:hypothetical protein
MRRKNAEYKKRGVRAARSLVNWLIRIRATPGPVLRLLQFRPKGWIRKKNAEYISFGEEFVPPTEA